MKHTKRHDDIIWGFFKFVFWAFVLIAWGIVNTLFLK
jgi:hypothetical protein